MRLIDADELIEKLNEYNEFAVFDCEAVKDLIDNAPTVKPKLKDSIIEAFNQITDQEFEHSDSFWIVTPKGKKIEFEKKRPQGEWKYPFKDSIIGGRRIGKSTKECSCCGALFENNLPWNAKFCPACGASMRKGGAE